MLSTGHRTAEITFRLVYWPSKRNALAVHLVHMRNLMNKIMRMRVINTSLKTKFSETACLQSRVSQSWSRTSCSVGVRCCCAPHTWFRGMLCYQDLWWGDHLKQLCWSRETSRTCSTVNKIFMLRILPFGCTVLGQVHVYTFILHFPTQETITNAYVTIPDL